MRVFFLAAFFILLCSYHADALVTISCGSPTGIRVDLTGRGTETNKDGFSRVYPKFIIDPDNPSNLVVLFSATKLIGPTRHDNASNATVIMNKPEQITAVEITPSEIWMYSLFPKKGFGFYTRTSHGSLDGSVHSAIFYSHCKFATD